MCVWGGGDWQRVMKHTSAFICKRFETYVWSLYDCSVLLRHGCSLIHSLLFFFFLLNQFTMTLIPSLRGQRFA